MSQSMFADRKRALGFAGVILAIAIVAAVAAGAFMPAIDPDSASDPETEVVASAQTKPAVAAPVQADAGWTDEGYADDWGAEATDSPASDGGGGNSREIDEPSFGNYTPDTNRAAPRDGPAASSQESSSPNVRSGAAPDAPRLTAPDGGGSNNSGQLSVE